MAKQTINIGTTANDGTGDPLRTALEKVNNNFTELYGVTANYMMMINGSGNVVASGIYQSAAGNLLLGTTTDDGVNKLQVNGGGYFAGKVGIGTTAPTNELEVYGTSSPRVAVRSPESLSETPEFGFQVGSGANSSLNTLGVIRAVPTQVDPSPLKADLVFQTNGGDSVVERLRITSSGNLLIGTTTDSGYKLRVNGEAFIDSTLYQSDGTAMVYLSTTNAGGVHLRCTTAHPMAFSTNATERMRIAAAGNVLIGTTTDDGVNKLQVNGGIAFAPSTTTTAPAAGGAGALPATPLGYATITINGTARKIAYYA